MNNKFFKLFTDLLFSTYSGELQILAALPLIINGAEDEELKNSLSKHLSETKQQVARLEEIFTIICAFPRGEPCHGLNGILKEGEEILESENPSPICDAALIAAAQKVEHYEIAVYTSLYNLAKHFQFADVADLLKETLKEEINADKTLATLAEGGIFTAGIDDIAEMVSRT